MVVPEEMLEYKTGEAKIVAQLSRDLTDDMLEAESL